LVETASRIGWSAELKAFAQELIGVAIARLHELLDVMAATAAAPPGRNGIGPPLPGQRLETPSQPAPRRPLFELLPDITPSTRLDGGIMSRTIKFAHAEGPEVLEFIEMEVPAPGPNEVRINVKAIGINRADSMWRNNKYTEPVKFPAGLGYDAAGIVDGVGKDVTDFAAGDAVSTIPAFSLNKYFTYGEVILVLDYAVVKHLESLSFVKAASVWMMYITAYGARSSSTLK
jgi:hypothetical protein